MSETLCMACVLEELLWRALGSKEAASVQIFSFLEKKRGERQKRNTLKQTLIFFFSSHSRVLVVLQYLGY